MNQHLPDNTRNFYILIFSISVMCWLLPLTRLNFTYRFSNVEDGKWGHIEAGLKGREWNGMVAQVSQ